MVECKACGLPMVDSQDWCLECGTARPGRLGRRPGWRTAASVAGATMLLVCGAAAASYAALTDDAGKKADQPADTSGTPIASVPAQLPAAVTPATTTDAGVLPGTTPTTATDTTATGPTLTQPTTSTSSSLPGLPTLTTGTSTGTTTSSPSTNTTTTTNTTTSTNTTTTTNTNTTTTTTTTDTTPTEPTLKAITLGADAADIYDPYKRAVDKGDPADAYDDNAKDSWFVQTAADGKPMQVGLLIDLETRKTVKQIEFATKTPGFRLEVYSTDGSALPPDILDTRWAHIASRSDVDQNTKGDNIKGDGKEIVALPKDGEQVRQLVLWFTVPPDDGATVRIRDVVLKG